MKFFKGYSPMWFSQMICKHEYTVTNAFMTQLGMGKKFDIVCGKCGKKGVNII